VPPLLQSFGHSVQVHGLVVVGLGLVFFPVLVGIAVELGRFSVVTTRAIPVVTPSTPL
jgi:hypothetical protein